MIIAITSLAGYSRGQAYWIVAVLSSALPHLVLLFGLRSKYLYVRRHVQQALILAAIRTITTALLVGASESSGTCWWIPINGALWLWGSARGLRQVKRGECWLMERGEGEQLPRPWAAQPALQPTPVSESDAQLIRAHNLIQQGLRSEAIECYLSLFRTGPSHLRQQAVAALEKLGEVEDF